MKLVLVMMTTMIVMIMTMIICVHRGLSSTGQEPLYERRADLLNKMPFGSRLGGGEIRQVMGTPPVNRHR